jgi:cytidyltransferase-like protein
MSKGELVSAFGEQLPSLDRQRFSDPEYLARSRYLASDLLDTYKNSPAELMAVKNWIAQQGEVLFDEEINLILERNITLPRPWTTADCQEAVPKKFSSINTLFNLTIPSMAEDGLIVGTAGGVYDILHLGHLLFLRECRKQCDVLVLGVDENPLIKKTKGSDRPFNDFAVRVGTLSELPFVDQIVRIPELAITTGPNLIPYMTFFYSRPEWYGRIGPNLRFFLTENDPATELKLSAADFVGARAVVLPKFTQMSTTKIARHFGLKATSYQPNHFGPNPWWIQRYVDLAKRL